MSPPRKQHTAISKIKKSPVLVRLIGGYPIGVNKKHWFRSSEHLHTTSTFWQRLKTDVACSVGGLSSYPFDRPLPFAGLVLVRKSNLLLMGKHCQRIVSLEC